MPYTLESFKLKPKIARKYLSVCKNHIKKLPFVLSLSRLAKKFRVKLTRGNVKCLINKFLHIAIVLHENVMWIRFDTEKTDRWSPIQFASWFHTLNFRSIWALYRSNLNAWMALPIANLHFKAGVKHFIWIGKYLEYPSYIAHLTQYIT